MTDPRVHLRFVVDSEEYLEAVERAKVKAGLLGQPDQYGPWQLRIRWAMLIGCPLLAVTTLIGLLYLASR